MRTRAPVCEQRSLFFLYGLVWLLILPALSRTSVAICQQPSPDAARAEEAARVGQYDLAAEEYARLIKEHPGSAELWSNLGSVQAFAGNCQQALRSLDKAYSLNSALFAPWYFSGFCHAQLHQDERAATELMRAIRINSRDANAWYLLAPAEGNPERLGAAFNALARALSLDPRRPEIFYMGGETALELAAECYSRVQAGHSPYADRLEGERDAGQGVLELAISVFQKAAQVSPLEPDIHFTLGSIYLEAGKLSEAEVELRKCLELFPSSATDTQTAWTRLRLARILALENKNDEAQRIVASLDPRQFEAREEFEDALTCALLLKQPRLTDQILGLAVQRFPGDPAFLEWKSRISRVTSEPPADAALPGLSKVGVSLRFVTLANLPERNFVADFFGASREYRQFRDAFLRNDVLEVAAIISTRLDHLPSEPVQAFALGEILHWLSYNFYEKLGTEFPDSEPAQMLTAENFASLGKPDHAI